MSTFILKVRKSAIYTILGKVWEQAAALIITWLLATQLSVEEYGIYNLLLGTSSFLGIITSFGLISSFQRFLPEFYQKKETHKFLWTIRAGLFFRIVLSILSMAIIMIFFKKIGPFFKIQDYFLYFVLFAIGLFFFLQAQLIQKVLEAMFLHKYRVYANSISSLLRLVLLFIIFYLSYGLFQVLIVDLVAYVVLFGFFYYYYYLYLQKDFKETEISENFSKSMLIKRVSKYSGFSFLNEAGNIFIDISMDFFIISHFLGPTAIGYYAFAARMGRIISRWMPSRGLKNLISPIFFARYAKTNEKQELSRMFQLLTKLNAFAIFPVFTIGFVYGKEIIQYVFDPKYLYSYPAMTILFFHYAMLAFPVALPLQAVEKPELVLIGKISSIYNFIMDIILIKYWGILGVAIATASALIFKKLFEYNMARKFAEIKFPYFGIIKVLFNCSIITGFMYSVRPFIQGILSLCVFIFLSGILYLVVSAINRVFEISERSIINDIIGKPLFIF